MNANKRFWQTAVILLPMICALSILPEIHAQNPASKSDVAQQKIKNGWRIVKGQVKSEQGEPLIGVTVYMEKGKVSGVTNIDGMRPLQNFLFLS